MLAVGGIVQVAEKKPSLELEMKQRFFPSRRVASSNMEILQTEDGQHLDIYSPSLFPSFISKIGAILAQFEPCLDVSHPEFATLLCSL